MFELLPKKFQIAGLSLDGSEVLSHEGQESRSERCARSTIESAHQGSELSKWKAQRACPAEEVESRHV